MKNIMKRLSILILVLLLKPYASETCACNPNKYFRPLVENYVGIDEKDFRQRNLAAFDEKELVYVGLLQYDDHRLPPFPYEDGRVKKGRYMASSSAMDKYIKSLSKYQWKKFSIVKFEESTADFPSVVMACENGDTLLFDSEFIKVDFITSDYLSWMREKIGGTVFYVGPRFGKHAVSMEYSGIKSKLSKSTQDVYDHFYTIKKKDTGAFFPSFPFLSEWKIVNVEYDPTYIGSRNPYNDSLNYDRVDRLKYTISNPDYGSFELFPVNIDKLWRDALKEEYGVSCEEEKIDVIGESEIFAKVRLIIAKVEDDFYTVPDSTTERCSQERPQKCRIAKICKAKAFEDNLNYLVTMREIEIGDPEENYMANWDEAYLASKDSCAEIASQNDDYPMQFAMCDASSGLVWCHSYGCEDCNTVIPQNMIDCAQRGNLQTIDRIVSFASTTNVSVEEMMDMLDRAKEKYGNIDFLAELFAKIVDNQLAHENVFAQTREDVKDFFERRINVYKRAEKFGGKYPVKIDSLKREMERF